MIPTTQAFDGFQVFFGLDFLRVQGDLMNRPILLNSGSSRKKHLNGTFTSSMAYKGMIFCSSATNSWTFAARGERPAGVVLPGAEWVFLFYKRKMFGSVFRWSCVGVVLFFVWYLLWLLDFCLFYLCSGDSSPPKSARKVLRVTSDRQNKKKTRRGGGVFLVQSLLLSYHYSEKQPRKETPRGTQGPVRQPCPPQNSLLQPQKNKTEQTHQKIKYNK